MPEQATLKRARRDKAQGKSPSTQAGEFVREEIEHIRHGKHGARSTKQAIAIGLSKARRSGVKLPPGGSKRSRAQARHDLRKHGRPSARRSRAAEKALEREPHRTASHAALARHAHRAAMRRSKADRSRAAKKAARTRKARG